MTDSTQNTPQEKKSRGLAVDLVAQVNAVRGDDDAQPTIDTATRGGLRAYFTPVAGDRRAGLVSLSAIRTREQGQVRTADPATDPDLHDLVQSIKAHGVIQPVGVSWDELADCFWTDVGHRRVAAARVAGLTEIPAVVRMPKGQGMGLSVQMTEQQLIENLQRTQLPALDVAHALKRLVASGKSAADVARDVGKSNSWISKHLTLLELPTEVLEKAEERDAGHEVLYTIAQAPVGLKDQAKLLDLGLNEGRQAVNRALEVLTVENANKSRPRHLSAAAKRANPAQGGRPSERAGLDGSRRVLAKASRGALEAVEHLDKLLRSARTQDARNLQKKTKTYILALKKFASGQEG